MVRILGNNLANKKKISIALTSIYGIGIQTALNLLAQVEIDPNKKVFELTEANISSLRNLLESQDLKLEGNLKRMIQANIRRLIDINCYRGRRHFKGLPLRGQRTRTNGRTSRKQNFLTSKD